MQSIIRHRGMNPVWNSFSKMEKELEKFFDEPFFTEAFNLQNERAFPKVDIIEYDNRYKMFIALPGFDKKDINLEIKDNVLKISGEATFYDKNNYFLVKEIATRKFCRTFPFPKKVDFSKVNEATLNNGILTIFLPKIESKKEENVKKIKIK